MRKLLTILLIALLACGALFAEKSPIYVDIEESTALQDEYNADISDLNDANNTFNTEIETIQSEIDNNVDLISQITILTSKIEVNIGDLHDLFLNTRDQAKRNELKTALADARKQIYELDKARTELEQKNIENEHQIYIKEQKRTQNKNEIIRLTNEIEYLNQCIAFTNDQNKDGEGTPLDNNATLVSDADTLLGSVQSALGSTGSTE